MDKTGPSFPLTVSTLQKPSTSLEIVVYSLVYSFEASGKVHLETNNHVTVILRHIMQYNAVQLRFDDV